jgi:hypothetical protein
VKGFLIQVRLEIAAAQGHNEIRQSADLQTHQSDFKACFCFRIVHKKIGHSKGKGIDGAARRNPVTAETVPAEILDSGQGARRKNF